MILNFDCRVGMAMYPDGYFDSIVTDPPYELGFMGKKWDATGIAFNIEVWREALRVLKPGGHLLAFSGTRTQHRMVCAIEDAGFEIRDQIGWAYGTGFPKSLDVSKAIDAAGEVIVTAPATVAAAQWQGWGTALKPAWEPICVARKPLIGTVAANVLAHGVGGLNIDGCRVPTDDDLNGGAYSAVRQVSQSEWARNGSSICNSTGKEFVQPVGRWPANIIHDGSDEVLVAFPNAPGQLAPESFTAPSSKTRNVYGARGRGEPRADSDNVARRLDEGSAARFFYCAKASKSDRGEGNDHPTVKPTELMRYLCRLITPPCGTVLDPFAGSGSTGKGAVLEGFRFIGFDLSPEYCAIGNARIDAVRK